MKATAIVLLALSCITALGCTAAREEQMAAANTSTANVAGQWSGFSRAGRECHVGDAHHGLDSRRLLLPVSPDDARAIGDQAQATRRQGSGVDHGIFAAIAK